MRPLAICLAAAALAVPAAAETAFDSTGIVRGRSVSERHVIEKGLMAVETRVLHEGFEMEAEGHPFAGLAGRCTGTMIARGIAASGGGVCAYEGEGRGMVVGYAVEGFTVDGEATGTWSVVGGTGALAGLAGGGRFVSRGDEETSLLIVGAVTLP